MLQYLLTIFQIVFGMKKHIILLNDLRCLISNKNWFEKFNPIKLFINDRRKNT